MAERPGWLETAEGGGAGALVLRAGGRWDLAGAAELVGAVDGWRSQRAAGPVTLDLSKLDKLDTAGAILLLRLGRRLVAEGFAVTRVGAEAGHAQLIEAVEHAQSEPSVPRVRSHPLLDALERLGRATLASLREGLDLVSFLGQVAVTLASFVLGRARFRFRATLVHIEGVGFDALPIVGLLSFLIGVVMAFQGAEQLRRFGADLYVANLLGVSTLREIGVLMTAIIVAGRSGSAFAAAIGTMKVNQEIDAMRTLGLDPVELLVVPRVVALMIALPLLAFFADLMGLLGGAVMSWATLSIGFEPFMRQLHFAITFNTLMVGLVKAPAFAMIIGVVGCFEGFQVTGSAESVGALTTKAVVESIFLVIVVDALFSVFFAILRV